MPLILLLRKLILGKEAFYYKGDHSQVTLRLITLPLLRECSIAIHQCDGMTWSLTDLKDMVIFMSWKCIIDICLV